jgi:hypothetical protein
VAAAIRRHGRQRSDHNGHAFERTVHADRSGPLPTGVTCLNPLTSPPTGRRQRGLRPAGAYRNCGSSVRLPTTVIGASQM